MSWPEHETPWLCPVCGAKTWKRDDTEEGRLLESEEWCKACRFYGAEFHYGHHEERIGFALFMWSYSDDDNMSAARKAAREEMRRVYAHPDFAAMRDAARWALADWFGDHDFPIQEEHLRQRIRDEAAAS